MALIKCEECGREVSDKAPACPGCGAPITGGASPSMFQAAGGNAMPVVAPPRGDVTETTYYTDQNGVRITNARAIIGARTYSMANLTTVTVGMTEPSKNGPSTMIGFGVLAVIGGAVGGSPGFVFIGVLLGALGGWLWSRIKDEYHVRIGSAGGESNALTSTDKAYIVGVAQALNEAIIKRG